MDMFKFSEEYEQQKTQVIKKIKTASAKLNHLGHL